MKKLFDIDFEDYPIDSVYSLLMNGSLDGKIIVTPNVDHVNRFHRDVGFRKIYSQADLYINDSRVLRLLSLFMKNSLVNVVPGSDLTKKIFEDSENVISKYGICVLGAEVEDIDAIKSRFSLEEIHHYVPPFGFETDEKEMERCLLYCSELPSCIYLISVGSPRQEMLALRLREAGVKGVFLCVGASVLFLSGKERRAPKIFQKVGFEWLYRLFQSPRRLYKRYLIDGPFIFLLFIKYFFKR